MKIGTPSVQGFLDNGKLPCANGGSIGRTPFIDGMEYSTDAAAQAAYVTNAPAPTDINVSLPANGGVSSLVSTTGDSYSGTIANVNDNNIGTSIGNSMSLRVGAANVVAKVDFNAAYTVNSIEFTYSAIGMGGGSLVETYSGGSWTTRYNGARQSSATVIITGPWTSVNALRVTATGISTNPNGSASCSISEVKALVSGTIALQSYSESTIKSQGSYSLRGVAAITDSLNKTLTRTFS